MSNKSLDTQKAEEIIRSNEEQVTKAASRKRLLYIAWGAITLASASTLLLDFHIGTRSIWYVGLLITAFVFLITGYFVKKISGNDYDKILKSCSSRIDGIAEYNNSKVSEHFVTTALLKGDCNHLEVYDQFIVETNSKKIDIHNLSASYRLGKRSQNFDTWQGLVVGMHHSTRHDYKIYITNSSAFKLPQEQASNSSLLPSSQTRKVHVSDSKVLSDWEISGLAELVETIEAIGKGYTLMITNRNIIAAIDDSDTTNFFNPEMWTADIKKNLTRDLQLLSQLVGIAKLIARLEIIEK